MHRRHFLKAFTAMSALSATPTWAAIGAPSVLGAAKNSYGDFVICGIHADGNIAFETQVPMRGHGFAVHPTHAIAVAFARRPGNIALVIDVFSGKIRATLDVSKDGHFYGHGIFTPDARYLLTTENHLHTSQGRVGIWDAQNDFKRVGERPTGGIGPHEMINLPMGGFAVANGGILTDPSSERKKLNIQTMDSSIAIFDKDLNIQEQYRLPEKLHKLSMRHIAAWGHDIAIGMQWEGNPRELMPVIGMLKNNQIELVEDSRDISGNYIGSVAVSSDGVFGFTAPKSGEFISLHTESKGLASQQVADIGGLAEIKNSFCGTAKGNVILISAEKGLKTIKTGLDWDNHLSVVKTM